MNRREIKSIVEILRVQLAVTRSSLHEVPRAGNTQDYVFVIVVTPQVHALHSDVCAGTHAYCSPSHEVV